MARRTKSQNADGILQTQRHQRELLGGVPSPLELLRELQPSAVPMSETGESAEQMCVPESRKGDALQGGEKMLTELGT